MKILEIIKIDEVHNRFKKIIKILCEHLNIYYEDYKKWGFIE